MASSIRLIAWRSQPDCAAPMFGWNSDWMERWQCGMELGISLWKSARQPTSRNRQQRQSRRRSPAPTVEELSGTRVFSGSKRRKSGKRCAIRGCVSGNQTSEVPDDVGAQRVAGRPDSPCTGKLSARPAGKPGNGFVKESLRPVLSRHCLATDAKSDTAAYGMRFLRHGGIYRSDVVLKVETKPRA